ncbi:MAG: hypothetical protein ABR903_10935 [Thermodesulfovibrionales bacterium]|jgi:hypothetical protein
MVRIVTQLLIGLMLFFGVATLAPRVFFHVRTKNIARATCLFIMCALLLFFSLVSFHYAYSGLTE